MRGALGNRRSYRDHQMKITLKDVKPPIWRRIQAKSDITLKVLHRIIQEVMGWEDAHLHQFNIFGGSPATLSKKQGRMKIKSI